MNKDPKFHERWEFRRRDEEFNSSSDDSKSSSSCDARRMKRRLLSSMILSQCLESNNDDLISQERNQLDSNWGASTEKHIGSSGRKAVKNVKRRDSIKSLDPLQVKRIVGHKKREANKKGMLKDVDSCGKECSSLQYTGHCSGENPCLSVKHSLKKQKGNSTMETALWDDLKTFRESVVGELKVARENMFTQMKDDMTKLFPRKSASKPRRKVGNTVKRQSKNKTESGRGNQRSQSCKPGVRSPKKKTNHDSNNCSTVCIEEKPFGSFAHINSKSLYLYDQNRMNMEFRVPPLLMYNASNISSQAVPKESLQGNNRLLAGNLDLAECFIANSLSSHMAYRRNRGLVSLRCQNYKEDHFLQNSLGKD